MGLREIKDFKEFSEGLRIERRDAPAVLYGDVPAALNGDASVKLALWGELARLWMGAKGD